MNKRIAVSLVAASLLASGSAFAQSTTAQGANEGARAGGEVGGPVGAIVGGITIGVLENLAEFFDSQYLQVGNLYNIAPFYVLLIILAFKPYGLFGTKDIERI